MGTMKNWITSSSPTVKILMAISVISTAVVIHRGFISPYVTRQRYKAAEEWANMIYELEEKEQTDSEQYNISY